MSDRKGTVRKLIQLANKYDKQGEHKKADTVDVIVNRFAAKDKIVREALDKKVDMFAQEFASQLSSLVKNQEPVASSTITNMFLKIMESLKSNVKITNPGELVEYAEYIGSKVGQYLPTNLTIPQQVWNGIETAVQNLKRSIYKALDVNYIIDDLKKRFFKSLDVSYLSNYSTETLFVFYDKLYSRYFLVSKDRNSITYAAKNLAQTKDLETVGTAEHPEGWIVRTMQPRAKKVTK
jgi:hypothetical protein